MMTPTEHALYTIEFINTYRSYPADQKALREAACLRLQFTHCLSEPEADELLFGKYEVPCVGFAMQESGMGYYFNKNIYRKLSRQLPEDLKLLLESYLEDWEKETGQWQLINAMPASMTAVIPNDHFASESHPAFWLCRMASTQMDFDRLLQSGLPGLSAQIRNARQGAPDPESSSLYQGMELFLVTVQEILLHCRRRILSGSHPHKDLMADTLLHLVHNKPESLYQAVQLMYLYTVISGSYNYGRMDEYLGDFYVRDLHNGVLTQKQAAAIFASLWGMMNHRQNIWDGRVIIGGRGRRNEENANALALLLIQVTGQVRDVLPQLTLRFYKGQSPELWNAALALIGSGYVYPMLYNDDVNIPNVKQNLHVSQSEAEQYVPFGCGEYIINHRSVGTPSDIVNLLKVLEITLFNGRDLITGKISGLQTGNFAAFDSFDAFFDAYCLQLERYVTVQAAHQALEYRVASAHSPFLAASILYDDCLLKGKAVFDGGAHYTGATYETYGNINTADSLTAIKRLVFEEKKISPRKLLLMLERNFEGFEEERGLLLSAPKYGNDDPEADAIAAKVQNHVCHAVSSTATENGLHTHLVVVINNSANTSMGKYTGASADGRKAGEPMANANNPSGGSDTNGLTALLNSLASFPQKEMAGSVQNLKLSKDLFTRYPQKTDALLRVYFLKGGSQLMLNVVGREDLERAIIEPEKYKNLIVRVGGFCARFVELEPMVQKEILSRTLY